MREFVGVESYHNVLLSRSSFKRDALVFSRMAVKRYEFSTFQFFSRRRAKGSAVAIGIELPKHDSVGEETTTAAAW